MDAAKWASDNGAWLKTIIDNHNGWLKSSNVECYQNAYDGVLEEIETRNRARGDGATENKLEVNYAQLIIDTVVDYMMGKEPTWTIEDSEKKKPTDDDRPIVVEYRKELFKLLRGEQTQRVLAEQLRQGCIAGYSCVISWVDEKGQIDYEEFPVQECIPVFDSRGRLVMVIRTYKDTIPVGDGNTVAITRVEVYDDRYITYYVSDETGNFSLDTDELATGNPVEHKAGRIPVSVFINAIPASYETRLKKAGTSDLGNGVLSLLIAYAHGISDKANLAEYLQDQYLLLQGVDVDENEVVKMRKARALALKNEKSNASFIAQDQSDGTIENYLNRLKDDIHATTFTPIIDNLSGATATEVKMKYVGLDIKAGKKEIYFNGAVKQFIKILTDFLNAKRLILAGVQNVWEVLTGQVAASIELYDAEWVAATLNRNIPQNFKEIADIVVELVGIVPDIYLFELLWFVDDPKTALEEIKKQKDEDTERQTKASLASMGYGGEFGSTGTSNNSGDT